ncbi:hypothetical protein PAPYR_10199 [Paratrimastix pyriformis]|uniref:Uncharacterized protein n=1 Tax=Paratrimastix pyriformis TaxID=342808 RepID=A0ABQ8UC47_9EUKA|nr:hypothetical protein PAPYR_10199 [Paratrimastix pyriformis]
MGFLFHCVASLEKSPLVLDSIDSGLQRRFGVFFQFPSPRAVCLPRDHLALIPNFVKSLFAILVPNAPLRSSRPLRDRSFEARNPTKLGYSKRETVSPPWVPVRACRRAQLPDEEPREGFPTELFQQDVHPAMLCPICQCVMRQAVTLLCRGSHKTCESCCQRWAKQKQPVTCPCCRQEIAEPYFNRDPVFNSMIQQLRVHCPQRPCGWQGALEDLTRHQTHECAQREVGCSHEGCTFRCPACNLQAHLDACEWHPLPCEKCGAVMARKDHQAHLGTVCPAAEVPCPDCHRLFRRSALDAHRAQCPEASLPCPVPGCDAQIARCRMEDHLAAGAAQHVTCLSRALLQGQAAAERDRAELRAALTAQQRLQGEVEALKRQVAGLAPALVRAPLAAAAPVAPMALAPVPLSPVELLAHLRRTSRVLSGGAADNGADGFCVFDLQARVPTTLRVVGLALYPESVEIPLIVSSRSASCRAPLADGWGAPLVELRPPLVKDPLVPVLFREPVVLAAGECITFRCANARYHNDPLPGNADLDLPLVVGLHFDGQRFEPRGFAGEIFYNLQD